MVRAIGKAVLGLLPEECDWVHGGPPAYDYYYATHCTAVLRLQQICMTTACITGRSHGAGVRAPACRALGNKVGYTSRRCSRSCTCR